jgi:hypothetical protein
MGTFYIGDLKSRTMRAQWVLAIGPLVLAGAICSALAVEPPTGPLHAQQAPDGKTALAAGPFVRMVRHNDGSKSITARDELTKELVISTYDPEGNLKLRRNYQLDLYGKPKTFLFYDGGGQPLVRGEYIYDAQDRVTEEKWFDMQSQKPIQDLAHNYDAKGKRLPPQTMHEATLPPAVVRWLEPDKAYEREQAKAAADKKAQEKKGFLGGLLNKKKDKDKKEQTQNAAATQAPSPPAATSETPASGSSKGSKGLLQGLFKRNKKDG